jgi:mannose-6-phosphate isomerase-like protein (cupin superfamily)
MKNKIIEIAERIRSLRILIGFTPEEMALSTGETVERYLEYENGQRAFPFGFLYHCAEKFDVDIVELMTGENPHLSGYSLVRQGEGLPIRRKDGFEYFHLAARFREKLSEPFLVRAPYREEAQSRPIELSSHEGQELDFVISGRLRFTFEGHIEELNPGDSVYYNSGKPHGMIATGGEDCMFLAVVIKKPEEDPQT